MIEEDWAALSRGAGTHVSNLWHHHRPSDVSELGGTPAVRPHLLRVSMSRCDDDVGASQSSSSHFNFMHSPTNPYDAHRSWFRMRPSKLCRFTFAHAGKKKSLRVDTQMLEIRSGHTLVPIWTPPGHLSHCPRASSGSFSLPACVFLSCPEHRSGLWHSSPSFFLFFLI